MKEIPLTNSDLKVIVDDEDYELLSKYRWHCTDGYAVCSDYVEEWLPKMVRMHRILVGPIEDGMQVDHINQNRLDNRKSNLRICTKSQNLMNRPKKSTRSTSKYKGVRFLKKLGYFQARISKDNTTYLLGHFTNEEAAAHAYNKAAVELHGEFCFLNDVPKISDEELDSFRIQKRSA